MNSHALSNKTKAQLNDHFELVDLGDINWLLGVSVTRDKSNKTISLGQRSYIELILTRFGLSNAHPEHTPMEAGADFHLDSPSISPTPLSDAEKTTYREIIGSLMYCATMMRPDIAYAVSMLSQFLETPRSTHLSLEGRQTNPMLSTGLVQKTSSSS